MKNIFLILLAAVTLASCRSTEKKINDQLQLINQKNWYDSEGRLVHINHQTFRIELNLETNYQDTLNWKATFLNDYVVTLRTMGESDNPDVPFSGKKDWYYYYYIEGEDNEVLRFEAQKEDCPYPDFLLTGVDK